MLLIVSHTPFLYVPKQFMVSGTSIMTTTADHPLAKADASTFLTKSDERE